MKKVNLNLVPRDPTYETFWKSRDCGDCEIRSWWGFRAVKLLCMTLRMSRITRCPPQAVSANISCGCQWTPCLCRFARWDKHHADTRR